MKSQANPAENAAQPQGYINNKQDGAEYKYVARHTMIRLSFVMTPTENL